MSACSEKMWFELPVLWYPKWKKYVQNLAKWKRPGSIHFPSPWKVEGIWYTSRRNFRKSANSQKISRSQERLEDTESGNLIWNIIPAQVEANLSISSGISLSSLPFDQVNRQKSIQRSHAEIGGCGKRPGEFSGNFCPYRPAVEAYLDLVKNELRIESICLLERASLIRRNEFFNTESWGNSKKEIWKPWEWNLKRTLPTQRLREELLQRLF